MCPSDHYEDERDKHKTTPNVQDRSVQAWTGHCVMALWRPPSTNTGAPWPLRNFLTCAEKNSIIAVAPCLRPWS